MLGNDELRRLTAASDTDLSVAAQLWDNRVSRPYRGMLSQTIELSDRDRARLATWAFVSGYYYFNGRRVRETPLQANLHLAIESYRQERYRVYANEFYTGQIDTTSFERRSILDSKPAYIMAFLLAVGGISRVISRTTLREVLDNKLFAHGRRVSEYGDKLNSKPSGMVFTWSAQHYRGAVNMYFETEADARSGQGYTEYRNVLGLAEKHCDGAGSCLGESSRGWVAIGSLIPIGARTCGGNCLCSYEYR